LPSSSHSSSRPSPWRPHRPPSTRSSRTRTKADIQAALDYAEANPTVLQYSQVKGVLEDYLATFQSPGATAADELKFTGGELLFVFAAGAGLIGSGAVLRRRRG
jgi:hypothetical protein